MIAAHRTPRPKRSLIRFLFLLLLLFATTVIMQQRVLANTRSNWVHDLANYVERVDVASQQLSPERCQVLQDAAQMIQQQSESNDSVALNFICTHNSRRSHLAQLFAAIAAVRYEVEGIASLSGGTESTACNVRIVRSLRRAGLSVVTEEPQSDNPRYLVQYSETELPTILFSKRYDDSTNQASSFIAMMCCSDADDACPLIEGASGRVSLHYMDPKISDDTPEEANTYDARRDEIAAEMFYMMRMVANASTD